MDRNMTRWAPLALALIVVVGVAATQQQSSAGIGLVNLQLIMRQTPGYQEALDMFEAEFEPVQQELQAMAERIDSLMADYERTQVILSPTARQERQNEIQQLRQRAEQRFQESQTRQQERERELLAPLEQRVQGVIEGVRAERNLTIILDLTTLGQAITAWDRSAELTPLVVLRLQSSQ